MWWSWILVSAGYAEAPEQRTEALQTRDGVQLEADLYPGTAGAPGVVLLHMIPPHWDRTSWPAAFVDALRAKGWAVCVPDRRGAGKSQGDPKAAYTGDTGRYDVEACVKRLQADGLGALAVIGASNGTTSALDYTALARSDAALPVPAALGFMTGGTYTVAQTPMASAKGIPAIFTYSVDERAWSATHEAGDPAWVHAEYPGGDHGTKMFDAQPAVQDRLVAFLAEHLEGPTAPASSSGAAPR